jgi:hypothetical protein
VAAHEALPCLLVFNVLLFLQPAPPAAPQDVLRLCGITQLLDAAMDGYNATVMCYGQTGSGKTFTMSGGRRRPGGGGRRGGGLF